MMFDEKQSIVGVVGGVIDQVDPSDEGWISLGSRVWLKPDGTEYEFPPEVPQKLNRFRGILAGDIIR